jgi:O-antigen ligase/tetratricopeptide (TPR) repeat protein
LRRPSSADEPGPPERRRSRLPGWLLVVPLPLSTALLAAVHPTPRAISGLVAAGIGLAAWRLGRAERLAPAARWGIGLAVVAWGIGLLSLLPVGPSLRVALQGGIGGAIEGALTQAGGGRRALAVDLPAALPALAWGAAMLTLAAGTAAAVHTRRRRLRLAWAVIATATATAALGFGQRAAGFETILGFTDVPAVRREAFFATFVNPNHAGTLLAAGAALAGSMLGRRRPTPRALGAAGVLLCLAGVAATGSRGAILSAAVGLVLVLALAAPPRVAMGAAGLGLTGLVAAGVAGGRDLLARLSALIDGPGRHADLWSGRLEFWADAVDLIAAAPALGVGPGGYDLASRFAKTSPRFIVPRHAHQEPLQALVEWGVPGGLLWVLVAVLPIGLGVAAALRHDRGRRRTLLAGWVGAGGALLIACLFDFPLRIGALSVLAALTWGALLGVARAPESRPVRRLGLGVFTVGVAGLACALMPLREGLAPGWIGAPGAAELATADEARRQARDLHLLEMDDPGPWRDLARAALASRIRARPLDAQPLLRLAQLELDRGAPAEALPILEAAVGVQPTLPWPWLGMARAAGEAGDAARARSAWRTGLALNLPDNDDAGPWVRRALDAGHGTQHWSQVIPDRPDRLRQAAVLLARQGEREGAEALFSRGVALDARVGVAWARWLVVWGDPDAALQLLEAVDDRGCPTLRVRGEALVAAARPADAVPWLVDARARCEPDPRLDRSLAMAQAAAGEAAGLAPLAAWLEEHPADHGARRALLRLLRTHARWDEIAPHLEALIQADVATQTEAADLPRARLGLPLR